MKKIVFVVGIIEIESNVIISIHSNYEGALKAWNDERIKLIEFYKRMGYSDLNEHIKKLLCEDPEKLDVFPQETPYIEEFELLD